MDTQLEGLQAIAPHIPSMRERVLEVFVKHGPLTDEEMLLHYCKKWGEVLRVTSILTRRTELVKIGTLHHNGSVRVNPRTGVNNKVWAVA